MYKDNEKGQRRRAVYAARLENANQRARELAMQQTIMQRVCDVTIPAKRVVDFVNQYDTGFCLVYANGSMTWHSDLYYPVARVLLAIPCRRKGYTIETIRNTNGR